MRLRCWAWILTSSLAGGAIAPAQTDAQRTIDQFGMEVGLAFSGRVLLETRKPPPEPVAVTVTCLGKPAGDWTDSKGRFSIPIGSTAVGMKNLSGHVTALNGCIAEVAVAGYERYSKDLGRTNSQKDLDAGDIILKPVAPGAASSFSSVTASAPENARREYANALAAAGARDYAKALGHLDAALKVFPRFAAASFLKGVVLERLNRREQARAAYLFSAESDPAYLKPLAQLAEMYAEDQEPAPAAEWARKANLAAPGLNPAMYLIEGGAWLNLESLDNAERAARDGLAADPTHAYPRLHKLLGETLFRKHKYSEAERQFAAYLQHAGAAADRQQVEEMAARSAKLAAILEKRD